MNKLNVSIVLEILGRPAEHIKEALTTLVLRIGSEKGVKIINKKIHEPIQAKDSKTLFTSFAEVDLELDSLDNYYGIIFSYMPSHIEIISPEKISLTNSDLNISANQLLALLHNYDAIAKNSLAEKDFLLTKLKEAAPELFIKKEEPKQENKKSSRKKV